MKITLKGREREGKKVFAELDEILQKTLMDIDSTISLIELKKLSRKLAKDLYACQNDFYELWYEISKSKQKEYSEEYQFKVKIFEIAIDYMTFNKFKREKALLKALKFVSINPKNEAEKKSINLWLNEFRNNKQDDFLAGNFYKDFCTYLKKEKVFK
jgi:hypothetical protein